jgi:parallel beta-helix repeat protein
VLVTIGRSKIPVRASIGKSPSVSKAVLAVTLVAVMGLLMSNVAQAAPAQQQDSDPPIIEIPDDEPSDVVNTPLPGNDGDISDCICDTGNAMVGFTKLCTLRAAIQTHNHEDCGNPIGFAGPFQGENAIKPGQETPVITGPISIDGLGQQVEISAEDCIACTRGLEVDGTAMITDLVVYGLLLLTNGNGSTVSGSVLGTPPDLPPPPAPPADPGVQFTNCLGCTAEDNIVAGIIQFDGEGSQSGLVLDNYVGVGPMGEDLGFGSIDFVSGFGNHTVRGNFVASNGFHIRLLGPNTGHSLIENNFVGISPTGMGLGGSDGIELRSDFNTVRENVVSGNGGHGISVVSDASNNLIKNNLIGTSLDGGSALGNGLVGVRLSGSGGHNIVRENVISANGAEGIYSNFSGDHNLILFNYVGTDESGTVALGNTGTGIRFTTGFVTVQGNLVSGNGGFGIRAEGATGAHTIVGNQVGTDVNGAVSMPNFDSGIRVTAPDVLIAQNVVSGNGGAPGGGHGIEVETVNATGIEVADNRIGVTAGGAPLGNAGRGIFFNISAHDNFVGPGNVVAFNGDDGLAVGSGVGNELTSNSVFDNGGLGIDLGVDGPTPNDAGDGDGGPNNFQNTPVLDGVFPGPEITGALDSQANRGYRIEIFSNPSCDPSGFGEGKSLVAEVEVNTDGAGHADFSIPFPLSGANPTATATDLATLDTSEFSPCIVHVPPVTGPINSVGDDDDQTPNDGICFTGNMIMRDGVPEDECTLRAAIQTGHEANAAKLLVFDIPPEQYPGDPLPIIRPTLFLPTITVALVIDGSSQPDHGTVAVSGSLTAPLPLTPVRGEGLDCGPMLPFLYQLDGSGADIRDQIIYCADVAVSISGSNNSIFLNLIADSGNGVEVLGAPATGNDIFQNTIIRNGTGVSVSDQASNTTIRHNLFGTDGQGTALGNQFGVRIQNAGENFVDDNTVVASDEAGIVIEDGGDGLQTTENLVRGNRIGTDVQGRSGLGNGSIGVWIIGARLNVIGGTEPGERNVISGNGDFDPPGHETGGGISLAGHNAKDNQILGNYIGTTLDGLDFLGNANFGILFDQTDRNGIGGPTAAERNVISGNVGDGIIIEGNGIADGTAPDIPLGQVIRGNFIGTDRDGLRDVGNGRHGIVISNSAGNTIGAADFASGGNLISGNNMAGVHLTHNAFATSFRNDIIGNRIGIDLDEQLPLGLGNGEAGIDLHGDDTLVKGNRIAYNGKDGVFVGETGDGNLITRNSISFNSELGIDLKGGMEDAFGVTANDDGDDDDGANMLNNFPVITSIAVTPSVNGLIATVRGTYDHGPGTEGPIQVFTTPVCDPSGHGEGEAFLTRHRRRTSGNFSAVAAATNLGFITATSSLRKLNLPLAHTSEFSACLEAPPPPPSYLVINEIDAVPAGQEFIEISNGGDGALPLTGKVLVLYDGAEDTSYSAFDLDGQFTDADGFFVAGNAAVTEVALIFADGLLMDGPAAAAIYNGDAVDFPDGTPVTTDDLIDAVVYGPADAPDGGLLVLLQAGQPQVDEADLGDIAGDALQRCPDSSGGVRYTDTYQASPPTPGDQNACVVCFIEPQQGFAGEGRNVSLTATVLVNAITPMAGIDVDFEVVSGPNLGEMASIMTDANGEAVFSYTGLGGIGDDELTASGMFDGQPFFCEAGVSWFIVPLFIHGFE